MPYKWWLVYGSRLVNDTVDKAVVMKDYYVANTLEEGRIVMSTLLMFIILVLFSFQ